MRKKIHKLIRHNRRGVNLVGDVNAVISTGDSGSTTRSSTRSRNRIVQQGGTTWSESDFTGGDQMTDKVQKEKGLDKDELEAQQGEQLPDREQMSLINANVAAPINAAVALNALSDNSVAYANAEQTNTIIQHN